MELPYEVGDVAYWPSQRYFGLLFAHTSPLSSPIIIVGKMTSGVSMLDTLEETETMTFTLTRNINP